MINMEWESLSDFFQPFAGGREQIARFPALNRQRGQSPRLSFLYQTGKETVMMGKRWVALLTAAALITLAFHYYRLLNY